MHIIVPIIYHSYDYNIQLREVIPILCITVTVYNPHFAAFMISCSYLIMNESLTTTLWVSLHLHSGRNVFMSKLKTYKDHKDDETVGGFLYSRRRSTYASRSRNLNVKTQVVSIDDGDEEVTL